MLDMFENIERLIWEYEKKFGKEDNFEEFRQKMIDAFNGANFSSQIEDAINQEKSCSALINRMLDQYNKKLMDFPIHDLKLMNPGKASL